MEKRQSSNSSNKRRNAKKEEKGTVFVSHKVQFQKCKCDREIDIVAEVVHAFFLYYNRLPIIVINALGREHRLKYYGLNCSNNYLSRKDYVLC